MSHERDQNQINLIIGRLERVEKENRRLKQLALLACLALVTILIMGQAHKNRTLSADKFVLEDPSGRVRAELSMDCKGPCLRLFDVNGVEHVVMSTSAFTMENGDVLTLKVKNDPSKGVGYSNGPAVTLSQSGLFVQDADKKRVLLDLGWPPADDSSLTLYHESGSRIALSAAADGPSVSLFDSQEFSTVLGTTDLVTTVTGETHKTSAASISLFGKDGKVLWKAP